MLKKPMLGAWMTLSLAVAPLHAAMAAYPDHPITIIVPYAAGASTDSLARIVGKTMSEELGQTVVVENKPGAGGIITADYVRQQAPDGYTFMLTTDGMMAVYPSIH